MQELMQIVPAPEDHVHVRLVLESFDCGDECSFEHWVEVCKLVDEGDTATDELDGLGLSKPEQAAWN